MLSSHLLCIYFKDKFGNGVRLFVVYTLSSARADFENDLVAQYFETHVDAPLSNQRSLLNWIEIAQSHIHIHTHTNIFFFCVCSGTLKVNMVITSLEKEKYTNTQNTNSGKHIFTNYTYTYSYIASSLNKTGGRQMT